MIEKTDKNSLLVLLFMFVFLSLAAYSWITNNFLAKTFVLGLEGCAMFTSFVIEKLFL